MSDSEQTKQQLETVVRAFSEPEHLKSIYEGEWSEMFDNDGNPLKGIRGKMGAVGLRANGEEFGLDHIEMEAGSAFELHVHAGDHLLFILPDSEAGKVHIDGKDHRLIGGDSIFIPGDYPHGVATFDDAKGSFCFIAIGVPHKPVHAHDRMTLVELGELPEVKGAMHNPTKDSG